MLYMGLLKVCSNNICPPTVGTYTFHRPILGFKISAYLITILSNYMVYHLSLEALCTVLYQCPHNNTPSHTIHTFQQPHNTSTSQYQHFPPHFHNFSTITALMTSRSRPLAQIDTDCHLLRRECRLLYLRQVK
jgi:hypothetical protein